jgi:hypothetical protein
MTATPLLDRIEGKYRTTPDSNVIELRKRPEWMRRRLQVIDGQSPFIAVKDTSEWRPEGPDAA